MFTAPIDRKAEEAVRLFRELPPEFQDLILAHMRGMVKITAARGEEPDKGDKGERDMGGPAPAP